MLLMFFIVEYILRIYHCGCQGLALGSEGVEDGSRRTIFLGDETTKSGGGIDEMEIYSPVRDRIEPRDVGICIIFWGWTTETPMEDLPSLLMSANAADHATTCPLLSGQNRNKTLPECRNDAKVESQSLTSSPGRIFWLDKQDVMKRLQHGSSIKREPHPCDSLDFPPVSTWSMSVLLLGRARNFADPEMTTPLLWNGFSLILWNYNRCSPSSLRKVWSCWWIDSDR